MPPSPVILHDLRDAYATGDLVVFAGAGVPAAAGLPTWPTLAQGLRNRLHTDGKPPELIGEVDELIQRRQLIDALSAIKHALGAHEFDLAVEKAVDDHALPVPDVATAIAELEPRLRAVVTTNLDRFLERAFAGNWDALTNPPGDLVQRRRYILKLHGTRIDRGTWVFTREQYDQATFGWQQHRAIFEALFHAHPILFVGYGLTDDDFDQTLASTRALAGASPPRHFALLLRPVSPYRRTKLEKAGLRLLEYDNHGEVPGILRSLPLTSQPRDGAIAVGLEKPHDAEREPGEKDARLRVLGMQLEAARERRQRLEKLGASTVEVDRETLNLRRELRAGGQLHEGDALGHGRYTLVRPLGKGGFASVWEAHDLVQNERVAVKVLHPELVRDATRLERFFRGAREMAELTHEAVVRVIEQHGEEDGWHYFVMELVPGGDLRRAVLEKRLTVQDVLGIIERVGDALVVAYAKRLIHRDVKPANILLDGKGAPKLTDFDLVAAANTTGGTRTGAMGTFLYAAPELMERPQDADARADVYGLGMTAVFALYGADLPVARMMEQRNRIIDKLPCIEAVKEVLKKAIAWEREERFADVQTFCGALRRATVADELEPLPSFEVPADRPVVTVRDLAGKMMGEGAWASHVTGVAGCASALIVRALVQRAPRHVVVVTANADAARALAADVSFLLGERDAADAETIGEGAWGKVLLFLPNEASPYADINPDHRGAEMRLATLFHLAVDLPWTVLVCPIGALSRKVVPKDEVLDHSELVVAEQELDRDALTTRLTRIGYVRAPLVEDPGTFALRGAFLDVWAPSAAAPVRVEFYGDLVMSLKVFEPESQRTLRDVRELWISPAREAILTPANVERARDRIRAACDAMNLPSSKARALVDDVTSGRSFFGSEGFLPAYVELSPLAAYLPKHTLFVLEDPASVTAALRGELDRAAVDEVQKGQEPHFPLREFYESEGRVAELLGGGAVLALHRSSIERERFDPASLERFEAAPEGIASLATLDQSDLRRAIEAARASRGRASALDPLVRRVRAWQASGLRVVVAARAATGAERLATLLNHRDLTVKVQLQRFDPASIDDARQNQAVLVVVGSLARGVVAPAEGLALVTEEEIFGARAHRCAPRAANSVNKGHVFVEDLRTLAVGDFVVHVEHGIGRYLGLTHKQVGALTADLLVVEYAGGAKLYVPVYRLNQVQKYSGADAAPKLDRLGGQTFSRTRAKVAKNLRSLAEELLRLYAERKAAVGFAVPPLDDEYRAFEATFPFEETVDQARAIADVDADLEAERPMDRLVCGDVGFGKTEVAIRAAFRMASAGRQVAILCPTTVLAQQHFLSVRKRMENYPIEVRLLSRFQSRAEQDAASRGLRDGTVDIVVGTHRLLSKDIRFKRLGLLVVDEEQRFGVAHKERIKQLKVDLNILTLSATPIPRTLQMAIAGLRELSIIATPPVNRRAIRTVVTRPDGNVIRDAVEYELGRGGQVFYVYNRIEGLYQRASRISELVPSARVAVAHGQLAEGALEQTMLDFIEGRYDVLCATAIIESGLDIPRANTIIIDRADMFGLSQLYQLRGRVGRAKERAYCYLVVPPANVMTDEARACIEALESHTELGSGFRIAALDLDLRGAGDLLGAEQSGTVAAVGFELFCQMLDEAVHELRGDPVVHDVDPELSVDANAFLSEDYVANVGVRLSLYKRLASATGPDEVYDLAGEMEDRFGYPPPEARDFLHLMRLKTELRRLRVLDCEATSKAVTLHLRDDTPLNPAKMAGLFGDKGPKYKLTADMRLTRLRSASEEIPISGLMALDKMLKELAGRCKETN